jgi:hypothetical protein
MLLPCLDLQRGGGRDAVAVAAAVMFGLAKTGEVTMLPLCLDLQRGEVVMLLLPPSCSNLQKRGSHNTAAVFGLVKRGRL